MKRLTIAVLIATQLLPVAAPAIAADLVEVGETRTGAFGGLQVRIPLDPRSERPVRAGLTFAPTLHSRSLSGEPRTRIGQGLEFGFSGSRRPALTLAGMRLDRLGAAQDEAEGEDEDGISTLAIVGIGVAVLAGALFASFQLCADGEICGSDRDD